jgi:hypothetical protein
MRLTSPGIQRLLNASERTLVDAASASSIKDLTAARLRGKVERARALKDKYTSLARERARSARGKTKTRGGGPRTDDQTMETKAEVFGVVLERFEKQQAKLDKAAARSAARPTGRQSAATPAAAKKQASEKQAPRKQVSKKQVSKKQARRPAPTAEQRQTEARDTPKDTLKAKARALVAKVRKRVARQEGTPATTDAPIPESPAVAAQPGAASTPEGEAEGMRTRSANAKANRVKHKLDKSHITRLHGHVSGRGQRAQARRDSK